jgi:hypothetical protein
MIIGKDPPPGTYKLFDPSGNVIMSGNFVDVAERCIPDSVARREARADAFKTEARAEAATRTLSDALAEGARLITAKIDALTRRADALIARDRKRRVDAAAKAKRDAEAEIRAAIDRHPDPDAPESWSGGLTVHAASGPRDRAEQREQAAVGDELDPAEFAGKPAPLDESIQTGPAAQAA